MRLTRAGLLRLSAAGAVGAAAAPLTGCGAHGEDTGRPAGVRPVTNGQADRLAVARFNLYDRNAGRHAVTITLPQGTRTFTFTGRADFRHGRVLAVASTNDQPPQGGLFAWNTIGLAVQQFPSGETPPTTAPTTVSQQGWQARAFDPTASFDQVLQIVARLGVDRPFNALLLRQNGATWKGSTVLDGTKVDLMAAEPDGPKQKVTYYVDSLGRLRRVDVDLFDYPTTPASVVIEATTGAAAVPVVEALTPKRRRTSS